MTARISITALIVCFSLFLFAGCTKTERQKTEEEKEKLIIDFKEEFDEKFIEKAEEMGYKDLAENYKKQQAAEAEKYRQKEEEIQKVISAPGQIVHDPFLEGLLKPEFPYKSAGIFKVAGTMYYMVEAEDDISIKEATAYVHETLTGRGISTYRDFGYEGRTISKFEMKMYRNTDTPGVLEVSYNDIPQPTGEDAKKNGLREAIRFDDEWMILEIAPGFGKVFDKRIVVYPAEDVEGPDIEDFDRIPEGFTRYPGSRRMKVNFTSVDRAMFGKCIITYVTTDPLEKVLDFYLQKKKEYYASNPHMKSDRYYRKGDEEWVGGVSFIASLSFAGLREPGKEFKFSVDDRKNNKFIYIYIYTGANKYLSDYVFIMADVKGSYQ